MVPSLIKQPSQETQCLEIAPTLLPHQPAQSPQMRPKFTTTSSDAVNEPIRYAISC